MSSGHDVSEYELDTSGLQPMFHHKNRGKIDEKSRKIMMENPWKNRLKIAKNQKEKTLDRGVMSVV